METTTKAQQEIVGVGTAPEGQSAAIYETPSSQAISGIDPQLARLITDTTLDLDRVKAVLALRREIADEEERKRKQADEAVALRAFHEAFLRCQVEIPIVVRDEENSETHSQYATLARIGEKIDHIVSDNGFTLTFLPVPASREGFVKLEAILTHVPGGYERRFEAEVPVDNVGQKGGATKTAVHGWRSSTNYIRRTLYELIFNVKSRKATPDDDGNAAGKITGLTAEQVEQIRKLVETTATDEDKMLTGYGVERIDQLSLIQFGEVRVLLEQKAAKQARAQKQPAERANAG
jgi:hypothetical protein